MNRKKQQEIRFICLDPFNQRFYFLAKLFLTVALEERRGYLTVVLHFKNYLRENL